MTPDGARGSRGVFGRWPNRVSHLFPDFEGEAESWRSYHPEGLQLLNLRKPIIRICRYHYNCCPRWDAHRCYPNFEVPLFLFLQQSPATTVKFTNYSALVLKIDLYSRSTGLRTTSRPPWRSTSCPSATMASAPALPTPFLRCRAVRGESARTSH